MGKHQANVRATVLRWLGAGFFALAMLPLASAQVAVSEGGHPNFSVPIAVPPGIAGLQPKLALQYTRGSGGPFATGWSLGGLSVITRCGSTVATDGVRRGVRYTSEDRFCLDGERLIQTDASGVPVSGQGGYGSAGSEYRTERDAYTRVRAVGGSSATGPESFKVWTKSGLIYEYGATADSRILTAGAVTVPMAWAANKISDTAENFISISYLSQLTAFPAIQPTNGREWMVSEIRYTGNRTQAPQNKVSFVYQDRPDKSETYHEGVKTVSSKRLSHISTFITTSGGDREITRLKLTYVVSPNTKKSMLESVQQCGGTGMTKCAPRTTFTYTPGPGTTFTQKSLSSLILARKDSSRGYVRGVYQGDFNGDGRQDLLVWDDDPLQNQLLLSNGNGTFQAQAQPLPGNPQIGHSNGCFQVSVADFNLDGNADVLHIQNPEARQHCGGVARISQIFLGKREGGFEAPVSLSKGSGEVLNLLRVDPRPWCFYQGGANEECTVTETSGGRNYHLTDVNGDGYTDIIFTRTPPTTLDQVPTNCEPTELTCIYLGGGTLGRFTKLGDAASNSLANKDLFVVGGAMALLGLPGYQADRLYVGDLNGDGLPDIFVRDTGKLYLALSTPGQYQERQVATNCVSGAEILDANGDGKWDIACMDVSNPEPFKTYINDGAGNFVFRANVLDWKGDCTAQETPGGPVASNCDTWARSRYNHIAADFDGDGISDIVAVGKYTHKAYPKYNVVARGQGDGTFALLPSTSLDSNPINYQERQLLVGDFTGSGALEFLSYSANASENLLLTRDDSAPPHLLSTVTALGNAQTRIHYRPLSDSQVYTRGSGAVYPIVDYAGAQWVVSALDLPNGVGGWTRTEYEYRHQRADISGRGPLGFAAVVNSVPAPGGATLKTLTKYRQDFPFTGLPSETRRYTSSESSWISLRETDYTTICDPAGSPKVYRPVISATTEQTRDLNGAPISHVHTASSGYTCFGDPQNVTVTTRRDAASAESYVKVTENAYFQDTTKWILGRLTSSKQTNTVPVATFGAPGGGNPGGGGLTIGVDVTPSPMVAGQPATRTWYSSGATSVSFTCTAPAGGYAANGTVSVNGSDTLNPTVDWVGKDSTCIWTASSPSGTATTTHVLSTVATGSTPTISVQRSPDPFVAGEPFQVTWNSTNADTVSYQCTSSGTGFSGSQSVATVNGSSSGVADPAWVGYPSNCVWTASRQGQSATYSYVMTTVAASTPTAPTVTVQVNPHPIVVGQNSTMTWSSSNVTTLSYACSAAGSGFNQSSGVSTSGSMVLTGQSGWVGDDSSCVWTATGPAGTVTYQHTLTTVHAAPTISVTAASIMDMGQTYPITIATTGITAVSSQCTHSTLGTHNQSGLPVNGSYSFTPDFNWAGSSGATWSCTWTGTGANGSASTTKSIFVRVPPEPEPTPAPTISVQRSPIPYIAGQAYQINWSSTNASSITYQCTSSGTGYTTNSTRPISGSLSGTAQQAWVNNPSNCVWTATGPGGSASHSYVMTTLAATPAPVVTVQVNPSPIVAGQNSTMSWSASDTTSLSYNCTASGTGFKQSASVSASGSLTLTGQSGWVGNPSTCTWTATGPGGTTTYQNTLTTVLPTPTISVTIASILDMDVASPIDFASSGVDAISNHCTSSLGTKSGTGLPLNGRVWFTPDASWAGGAGMTWSCTYTGTGPYGSVSTTKSFFVRVPPDPNAGS